MVRVEPDLFTPSGRGRFLYDGAAIGYAREDLHHALQGLRTVLHNMSSCPYVANMTDLSSVSRHTAL